MKRQLLLLWLGLPLAMIGPGLMMLIALFSETLINEVGGTEQGQLAVMKRVLLLLWGIGWLILSGITLMGLHWMKASSLFVLNAKRHHGLAAVDVLKVWLISAFLLVLPLILRPIAEVGIFSELILLVADAVEWLVVPLILVWLITGIGGFIHLNYLLKAMGELHDIDIDWTVPALLSLTLFVFLMAGLPGWLVMSDEVFNIHLILGLIFTAWTLSACLFGAIRSYVLWVMLIKSWMDFDAHADFYMRAIELAKGVRLETWRGERHAG